MSNAGDGGGALWPGAKCQGLSLRQSSHDKRSSEVRRFGLTGLTQPIFLVLVKGGNHIIPTTWEPEPESSVEIGRVAVRVFGGFDLIDGKGLIDALKLLLRIFVRVF